jgi:tetratricopeptide (TPR) repeat protein
MATLSGVGLRGRVRRWWHGRRWRLLLCGLPALLAAGGILVLIALSLNSTSAELDARYLEKARAAYKARNYREALTCYERLAPSSAQRPEVIFGLGVAAQALGDHRRALLLITPLAPAKRKGYPPAHYWMAQQFVLASPVEPPPEAETHLLSALEGGLEDPAEAHGLLGRIYLTRDRPDDAKPHLTKAVGTRPEFRLELAQLYLRKQEPALARHEAEMVVREFRGRAQANRADHRSRLLWAEGLRFLDDFPGAVAVLEEGAAAVEGNVYPHNLARIYLAWYDTRARAPGARAVEHVALLEKGLRYDPTNKDLLDRLIVLLRVDSAEASEPRKLLHHLAATGKGSAFVHFLLGSDAMQRGRPEEARVYWERAFQLDPGLDVVGNNLAYLLAQPPTPDLPRALELINPNPLAAALAVVRWTPDLPRALELINRVIERAPGPARFRETRGHILVKMKRWREALPDLEEALAGLPQQTKLHETLAEVYDNLGVPDMAAKHRRLGRSAQP